MVGFLDHLLPDALTRFLVQALVIIASSRVIGLLARRVGQPMVIAEITAGILLGPSLLGWLAPDVSAAVFPASSLGVLQLVSQLGLVLFMFLVGLELDPAMLKGRGHTSVAISHTSIVVPFLLGGGLAFVIFDEYAPPGISETAFALFMGAAMSITAFPVLARILTERRLLRSRVGTVAIACAAIDDVTAWCILAFVVAVTRTHGLESAAFTTLGAGVFIGIMLLGVRPMASKLARKLETPESITQNIVALVVGLVIVSAWATELIGIHALFGAFLFGASMPKGGAFARRLAEKLEDVVTVVLLPLFFAFSGLRTNIALLDTPGEWGLCAVIIVLACAGKFGGSFVAARLTGLSWRESGAIGVLMNTRGLMELIVLNIGLDLGVISPTIFSMMVLMALVTTFITTPLLQIIYPQEEMARVPADVANERPGYGVLACITSDRAGPGLATLTAGLGARAWALHLMTPSDRGSTLMADMADDRSAEGARVLAPFTSKARALAIDAQPLTFVSGDPASDICKVARTRKADMVLLDWQPPFIGEATLGTTAHEVLRDAIALVGVLSDRGLGPEPASIKRVLVPFRGSPNDRAALAFAQRLRQSVGAEVTVLQIVHTGEVAPAPPIEAGRVLTAALGRNDDVTSAIVTEARLGYDLVAVGYEREWGFGERLLPLAFGFGAEPLLRDCPTSLLVVRAAREVSSEVAVRQPEISLSPR